MILLDTNILIDGERYVLDAAEVYAASMVSRAELELGVARATSPGERRDRRFRLAGLDEWLRWLPFDRRASEGYGAVASASGLTGARLRNKDALIAGQAYGLGLAVMTANTADFAPFAALLTVIEPTVRQEPVSDE